MGRLPALKLLAAARGCAPASRGVPGSSGLGLSRFFERLPPPMFQQSKPSTVSRGEARATTVCGSRRLRGHWVLID
jgi:hypothetical protein